MRSSRVRAWPRGHFEGAERAVVRTPWPGQGRYLRVVARSNRFVMEFIATSGAIRRKFVEEFLLRSVRPK